MNNIIRIVLKDAMDEEKNLHQIEFESNPTLSELCAAVLILEEVIEHNFSKEEVLLKKGIIYPRLSDLEEIRREK